MAPRNTAQEKDSSAVKAARISARQGIIVALIAALSGIVGAAINHFQEPAPEVQHYIHITGVSTQGLSDTHPGVRIVLEINRQFYSYPSDAVWADTGQGVPGEAFPLPTNQSEFELRFSAFYRADDGSSRRFVSSEEVRYSEKQIPVENTFPLVLLDSEFKRGVQSYGTLIVRYEIK